MLANVKEEHLSPPSSATTNSHHPNHQQQPYNGQQQPTTSSGVMPPMMMAKEEVQMGGGAISSSSGSTTPSSNNNNNNNMNSMTPNGIPPSYQQSGVHENNGQHGYYPPIHHHHPQQQQQQYGYGSYGHHHPYPTTQQMSNTLPSLSSTASSQYGMSNNTTIEGYAPNPQPTNNGQQQMNNIMQQQNNPTPPQFNNNMENVQQQGVHQQMYQQSNVPPQTSQNTSMNVTTPSMNNIPPSSVTSSQPAQNQTSSQQQSAVTHTIFHEYQTHKKSSSPVNDTNSGEYHPIACIPCRKRHKKCDRLLPKCSECGKRGIDCQYYEPKQKGRKKKDDIPNSSEFSPQPSSPTNATQSEQYSTPQTPTTNYNFQQPSYNNQQVTTPENSPASFQTRERSASYQKYRSEPYPSVNRSDIPMYNNNNGSNSMNSTPNVTPQRERAVSSASSSNYYSSPYFNSPINSQPVQNNSNNGVGIPNIKTNNVTPLNTNNQYLQPQNRGAASSSSPDSTNDANLPPYAKFIPIEKEKLKDELYIRRGDLESWDTFRVAQWVDTLDASFPVNNVGEIFKHHDIDGLAFFGLHNQVLMEMGISKVGVRLRLVRIIDHLRLQN